MGGQDERDLEDFMRKNLLCLVTKARCNRRAGKAPPVFRVSGQVRNRPVAPLSTPEGKGTSRCEQARRSRVLA